MNDDEFAQAFLTGSLPPGQFHHRDHLRLAWVLIRRHGLTHASAMIGSGIRHYAAAHGHTGLYHETLTQFWIGLVGHLVQERPEITDFEAFLVAFPHVLDKGLPARHWQQDTLGGSGARATWVAPDRLALPW